MLGLTASSPDMQDTLEHYLDESNMHDISIISTMGLNDEDIETLKNIEGVKDVYGIQTKDTEAKLGGVEKVIKVLEYNENINTPVVLEGRLPENENECLIDEGYNRYTKEESSIGKKIIIENDDTDEDGNSIFNQKEFEVVGVTASPLYISKERGTTSVGSGSIDLYIYTKDSVINMNYYTEIGITVKGAKETETNSDNYLELVNGTINEIEKIQKENLKKIEKGKWYIQDRLDNTGYTNIFDAIKTMSNISKIFPAIFYLVAVLISLTSMTRMIEEERVEIGTLKALGYTNIQIILKYVIYALLASVVGGILGMSVGFYLLPAIVWSLYSMIYTIPKFYYTYRLGIGLIGIIIAFVCIGGTTIVVANKELKQMPSVLMRPKAPKYGKKILLERITFIWKKFSFSQKVTIRNIFRYKKRALMTIIGIAGCTGLMLTGFGIRDSVVDIPNVQFGELFKYETSVTLLDTTGLEQIEKELNKNEKVENYTKICATTGTISKEDNQYDVNVFIPEEKDKINSVCALIDSTKKNELSLSDNGIIITDKIAERLNINEGDEITFIDGDGVNYTLKVEGIIKNYVGHYVYMSKGFYEQNISSYKTNMILLNTKNMSDDEQSEMREQLLQIDGVASVSIISSLMKSVSDMLNTMNYVVVVLIVASALLAFVVLYNLANINIGERQREIATLKVLGFRDKEVDNYINKENLIFTTIGIILGLIFGTLMTAAIIKSIEIDSLKFMQKILPSSYVFSTIITLFFSITVNYIIHFILKKIDMIASLKSVE